MSQLIAPQRRIVRTTLADSVYETLLDAIISGEVPPGAVLSVVQVSKDLDVSRTPVNEALRQLARDGVVEQKTNRRARVVRFTHHDVFEIFEMRKVLEGAAAERACRNIAPGELAWLLTATDELGRSRGGPAWASRWVDHDEAFHSALARASGLGRLAEDIGRYRLLHRVLNLRIGETELLREALAEHCNILAAIKGRRAAAARRAMVDHIQHWQEYFVEHFPGE